MFVFSTFKAEGGMLEDLVAAARLLNRVCFEVKRAAHDEPGGGAAAAAVAAATARRAACRRRVSDSGRDVFNAAYADDELGSVSPRSAAGGGGGDGGMHNRVAGGGGGGDGAGAGFGRTSMYDLADDAASEDMATGADTPRLALRAARDINRLRVREAGPEGADDEGGHRIVVEITLPGAVFDALPPPFARATILVRCVIFTQVRPGVCVCVGGGAMCVWGAGGVRGR